MNYLDKYCITYNGEIYNYIEIRAELIQNGYHFVSESDTEVILAAYDFGVFHA
jgi:asparagine synthase (glutamine-hydrolysing)